MLSKVETTIGQRITAELKRKEMSMRALAREMQVAQPTVYKWCHDQSEPMLKHIRGLAAVFKVSPLWLMYGDDAPIAPELPAPGNLSIGNGGIIYRNNESVLYYPMETDEMEPTVKLGDIAVVDRAVDRIGQSGIYLIVLSGEKALRRFSRSLDGALRVSRDNKATYPDVETIDDAEGIQVLGKVISKVRVDKLS